ncbi:MAG: DUF2007 domain-containing protein [Bacteroidota bacterium]|nr:DUF2007 domain-containing protein [Bacteroidota bacterium]
MEGYLVIATYSTEIDAELAQATLAAAGIESFLKYEDSGHMMPVLQQAEGVKLLVAPEFVEEARAILTTPPSEV